MPDHSLPELRDEKDHDAWVESVWRIYLTTGEIPGFADHFGYKFRDYRSVLRWLPSDPRCPMCAAPFTGLGAWLVKTALGKERSKLNPYLCNACDVFAQEHQGGADVPLTMMFADVRGSTSLAEAATPTEFRALINRFYSTVTDAMLEGNALIEKLMGDEVTALFVPGIAGADHARGAVQVARDILRQTGHADPDGPWVPVGIGVHTGRAFVGAVGREGGVIDIAALGDDVNVTARLASLAGPGEALVSVAACEAAGEGQCAGEQRSLALKGRAEPIDVCVLTL